MIPESFRLRVVRFAFLFGPPRVIEREDAASVHAAVCDALQQDDLTFRYAPRGDPDKPGSRGMSVVFEREEGQAHFTASIDVPNVNVPIRLLLMYDWPPSPVHVNETFDMASKAVFDSLPGPWTKVDAEARLMAQCDTREKSGLLFLTRTLMRVNEAWLSGAGVPLLSSSVKFEVGATSPAAGNQLEGAARELQLSVLREDPRCVYLELMSKWPQLPAVPLQAPEVPPVRNLRRIEHEPSDYVSEAYAYLQSRVKSFRQ